MRALNWDGVLDTAVAAARDYLHSLPERQVYRVATPDEIRAVLDVPLPDSGCDAQEVVAALAQDVEPYITAHASGRYFGFVIGGVHPASYGAEILTATWDQNAGLFAPTPGVAVVEEVATRWLVELLGLPAESSVGLVTGGQMATFTCLAAARDQVLRDVGWDVEADGLQGAPPLNVVVKSGKHTTVPRALRYLGLGERRAVEVACDDQDRLIVDDLRATLARLRGPTIICAEAGNVNTGSFDLFDEIADAAADHRAGGHPTWVHVDGAVGLLAAAANDRRHLTAGIDRLDSWSTDGHKLLNVAYDCGVAICRHPAAHRAAMSVRADYLVQADGDVREAMDWTPEFSRRARGLSVYAVLRSLGRTGLADVVDRCHTLARRFADQLSATGRVEIANDVVFNQVLVRWLPAGTSSDDDADAYNDAVVACVQRDGDAFFSGTRWRGRRMMRVSVSNWATDADDVDRAIGVLLRCADAAAEVRHGEDSARH